MTSRWAGPRFWCHFFRCCPELISVKSRVFEIGEGGREVGVRGWGENISSTRPINSGTYYHTFVASIACVCFARFAASFSSKSSRQVNQSVSSWFYALVMEPEWGPDARTNEEVEEFCAIFLVWYCSLNGFLQRCCICRCRCKWSYFEWHLHQQDYLVFKFIKLAKWCGEVCLPIFKVIAVGSSLIPFEPLRVKSREIREFGSTRIRVSKSWKSCVPVKRNWFLRRAF